MKTLVLMRYAVKLISASCFCRGGLTDDVERRLKEKEAKVTSLAETPGYLDDFLEKNTFKNLASSKGLEVK